MTIKTRNRINIVFTCIAIVITVLQSALLIYQLVTNNLIFPKVYNKNNSDLFIFSYKPIFVIIGVFMLDLYVIISSILIQINFEKTQSTEIVFILIFLIACICDSTRILVPLLKVADTYSRLLMHVAFVPLFARFLAPLSILGTTVLSDESARHNVDRNFVFIIITSLFFAKLVPFNTAVIFPNFCISYGYTNIIRFSSFFICIAGLSALFLNNRKNKTDQKTTIGLALLSTGYSAMFYCYNLVHLIFGSLLLVGGSYLYLRNLHRQYLWSDDNYNDM